MNKLNLNKIKRGIFILKLMLLKYKAQQIANRINDRVFIIKINNKYTLLSRRQFKSLKRERVFPKNFTMVELSQKSLFVAKPNDKERIQRLTK